LPGPFQRTPALVDQNPQHGSGAQRGVPSALRILDWTRLDAPPSTPDIDRLLRNTHSDGQVRLAVLVSTPRMLLAAMVFAEQAELQGAQVRVFVGATEAVSWLYRDVPQESLGHDWPVGTGNSRQSPFRCRPE
jgi:hypothetical protein